MERAPFEHLVKLVEHELELAAQGKVSELNEAVRQTGAYMATLPNPAPDAAQPLVLRASALRGRLTIEVRRLRDELATSRATMRRARQMTQHYRKGPAPGRYSTSA
jgi:hypothetical protein